MTEQANPTAAGKQRPRALVGIIAAIAGALSGLGGSFAARAAVPSEIELLRKDIAGVLERLRRVELAQAREEGAAGERQRRQRESGR